MYVSTSDLKRALAGKDVLGALAVLLLLSGMASSTIVANVGTMLATSGQQNVPLLTAVPFDLLVVTAIYLQAVGLAALYRVANDVYRAFQEAAGPTGSA